MAIPDRDRKMLWGRAGNRCSICRLELSDPSRARGRGTVLGEECHIVSGKPSGPRASEAPPGSIEVDSYTNLVLLCPTHHSVVDQDVDTYGRSRLLEIKTAHESWVRHSLSSQQPRVGIRRGRSEWLAEITDAGSLLDVVADAHEFGFEHDEPSGLEDVDLIADFIQQVHDLAEMWSDFEPGYRVRAQYALGQAMASLRSAGWRVFGSRVRGTIGAGVDADTWETARLRIVREDSADIVRRTDVSYGQKGGGP